MEHIACCCWRQNKSACLLEATMSHVAAGGRMRALVCSKRAYRALRANISRVLARGRASARACSNKACRIFLPEAEQGRVFAWSEHIVRWCLKHVRVLFSMQSYRVLLTEAEQRCFTPKAKTSSVRKSKVVLQISQHKLRKCWSLVRNQSNHDKCKRSSEWMSMSQKLTCESRDIIIRV